MVVDLVTQLRDVCSDVVAWLQPAATHVASAASSAATSSAGDAGGGPMACGMQAGMIALMMAVLYFFLLRPENKRREEMESLLRGLKKGQKVRTSGGILGEIISLTDREVVLGVADKVRLNVLRSAIAGVEPDPKDAAKEEKKDEKKEEKA